MTAQPTQQLGVYPGRYTAEFPAGTVVVLIGMRFNRLRSIRQWWPVFTAMPRMLRELAQHRALGLLGARSWVGWRTVMVQEYWTSMDDLMAYARGAEHEHFPAWRAFNRRAHNNPAVGIWHEAYVVTPEGAHAVYVNMPVFGMAGATQHVPATHHRAERQPSETAPVTT